MGCFLFSYVAKFCENFGKIWTKLSCHTADLSEKSDRRRSMEKKKKRNLQLNIPKIEKSEICRWWQLWFGKFFDGKFRGRWWGWSLDVKVCKKVKFASAQDWLWFAKCLIWKPIAEKTCDSLGKSFLMALNPVSGDYYVRETPQVTAQ